MTLTKSQVGKIQDGTKKVFIEYMHKPVDPKTDKILAEGEYFYEPVYKRCAICKLALSKFEEELIGVLARKCRDRLEFMSYRLNEDEKVKMKLMEIDHRLKDPYENLFTFNSKTSYSYKRYNRLNQKDEIITTAGYLPHVCLKCFREETEQTHTWYDIPLASKYPNTLFNELKTDVKK